MAFSATYALLDPTFGTYYTQFSNSFSTIPLGAWFKGRTETQNNSTRTLSPVLTSAMVDNGSTINADGTINFKAQDAGANWEYDITPTVDATNESVTFTPAFRYNSASSFAKSCSMEFRVAVLGSAADCRIMMPDKEHTIQLWSDVGTAEKLYLNPGIRNSGGGTGAQSTDEPSGEFAGSGEASYSQCVYLWNKTTLEGILFRFNDIKGRGKAFGLARDAGTGDIIVLCRFANQDCSTGVNNNSSEDPFDYGLEVRPMTGTWYDALEYHRSRQIVEGHPAYTKGKLRSRSDLVECSAIGAAFNQSYDFPQFVQQEFTRIQRYFEIDPAKFPVIFYGFGQGSQGFSTPFLTPFVNGSDQAMSKMHDLGFKIIPYTFPLQPNVANLPGGYGINADVVVNRSDQAVTQPKVANPSIITYVGLNWMTPANNTEYLQTFIDEMVSGLGVKWDGFYLDAHNAYMPLPNDDTALNPADRSIGSKTWTAKNAEVIETMRTFSETAGVEKPIMVSEWPNEFYMAECDMQSFTSLEVDTIQKAVAPGAHVMWGEYTQFFTFEQFGTGPLDTLDFGLGGWATTQEVFAYYWSWHYHIGQIPSFLAFFITPDTLDPYKFIPLESEGGYKEWYLDSQGFYRHLKNWFNKVNLVDHIRKCKMLRPLVNSQIERTFNAVLDSGPVLQPEDKVHSSVWYEDTRDIVYLMLSNWSCKGDNPVTHEFSISMPLKDYPELGAAERDIFLWNGGVTNIGSYDGATTISLSVEMKPEEVAIIGMPLRGEAWVAPQDVSTNHIPYQIASLGDILDG